MINILFDIKIKPIRLEAISFFPRLATLLRHKHLLFFLYLHEINKILQFILNMIE